MKSLFFAQPWTQAQAPNGPKSQTSRAVTANSRLASNWLQNELVAMAAECRDSEAFSLSIFRACA